MASARAAIARTGFFGAEPCGPARRGPEAVSFETVEPPVYEVTPNAIKRYQAMVISSTTRDLADWAVIAAGGAFFALAGLLTGAWLHI
jgi:hypothetical protein